MLSCVIRGCLRLGPPHSSLAVPQLGLRLPACPQAVLGILAAVAAALLTASAQALRRLFLCMLLCHYQSYEEPMPAVPAVVMLWRR